MTCTDFLSQLTDYFDGQIDPELLAEVQRQGVEGGLLPLGRHPHQDDAARRPRV